MHSRSALIVDDSRLAQHVLKGILEKQSFAVDTSKSAEEALGYLSEHKPGMIFMDHTMPGMNGLEALKAIKSNPETSSIPVMMYTSQEDAGYMNKARELGAIGVLHKKAKAEEMALTLNRLGYTAAAYTKKELALNEKLKEIDLLKHNENNLSNESSNVVLDDSVQGLKSLVADAEAILESGTSRQRMHMKIHRLEKETKQAISDASSKIDEYISSAEARYEKRWFWNNVFWSAACFFVIIFFTSKYFKQQGLIENLESSLNVISSGLLATSSAAPTDGAHKVRFGQDSSHFSVSNEERISNNGSSAYPVKSTTEVIQGESTLVKNQQLSELQALINSDNEIPFAKPLLGKIALNTLNELVSTLKALDFSGEINVLAHEGTFCVSRNGAGGLVQATDGLLFSDCQFSSPLALLEDIATVEFLQRVKFLNESNSADVTISVEPRGFSQPLMDYPDPINNITAGDWNLVAAKNRRIEFKFLSKPPAIF